jgi:hypothetical protein
VNDHPLDRDRINELVSTIFADDLHAKRVGSLANAAVGVQEGTAAGIHGLGRWWRDCGAQQAFRTKALR